MERSRLINLAKRLKEVAKELQELAKAEPQLFESPLKEKIISTNKKQTKYYIEAQEIISEWAIRWSRMFKTEPIVQKAWVFMMAPILARETHSKQQIINALASYFGTDDTYLYEKARYSFPFFVSNINKYLSVKPEREEVYE